MDTEWLPPREREFEEEDEEFKKTDNDVFLNIGGGDLRNKTDSNSHVKMKHQNYELGWARHMDTASNHFIVAPIVDYASGDYDGYLDEGTHADGTTKYTAGGLIGRGTNRNGFYYEGSLRGGRVKTDFSSNNLDKTGNFGNVTYSTSAPALAGHIRLGKHLRLDRNNLLDVYGIYFHAHQGGMNADLSSGEHYSIDSADSGRARL